MSLLRRTRTEVAGAWRSLRYDLGRTPAEPPADGPDVTSTGMSTFGGAGAIDPYAVTPAPVAVPAHRRPRRAVAVAAFGTLTVVGAASAYLAVVNGLGSLLSETSAAAGTVPARPAATTDARLGAGPASSRPARRPVAEGAETPGVISTAAVAEARRAVPGIVATTPPSIPGAVPPPAPAADPVPASPKPAKPECRCAEPPVPTPTAPSSSPSPTPSASPSASDSPDPSPADPSPTESSATPDDSATSGEDRENRRHRRHR